MSHLGNRVETGGIDQDRNPGLQTKQLIFNSYHKPYLNGTQAKHQSLGLSSVVLTPSSIKQVLKILKLRTFKLLHWAWQLGPLSPTWGRLTAWHAVDNMRKTETPPSASIKTGYKVQERQVLAIHACKNRGPDQATCFLFFPPFWTVSLYASFGILKLNVHVFVPSFPLPPHLGQI